jgi:translocation and assembly module TamB
VGARRRFGWAVAIIVGVALVGSVTAYWVVTGTEYGRHKFITWALNGANGVLGGRGRLTVGVLHELNRDGIYASDVSLLDTAGAVVVHVNELHGQLSYSALLDKSIHITHVDAQGVQVNLRKDFEGPWNVAYIINGGPKSTGPRVRGFGDDVLIDVIALSDASIAMQYPWSPNEIFTGHGRDSVIVARKGAHDLSFLPAGIIERRHIELPRVVAHTLWIATPNGDPASMKLDTLGGRISDPAVRVVQASGNVQWTPDSLMLALPAVQLPASTGSAKGSVNWNSPGPVHYDVTINAQAGLSDLGWIWDVLPESGKGSALVRMHTLENADDTEFALSKLDVTAMDSHVSGDITVLSRPTDILLSDVNLAFEPLRSELLRRLSYGAIPEAVKGTFRGTLKAGRGGPLTSFLVDRISANFADDHVPGATSSLVASGLVGFGQRPTAHNVDVQSATIDLRSVRAAVPSAPPVDGIVHGSLHIASADLTQAQIPTLNLTWVDAVGNTTQVSGHLDTRFAGRVPSINTELALNPLSLKSLVRIDSTFPLAAELRGTMRASGTLDSLSWDMALENGLDRLVANGTAGLRDSVWSFSANSTLKDIDLTRWVSRVNIPSTALNGPVRVQVTAQLRPDSTIHLTQAEVTADVHQLAGNDRPAFVLKGTGGLNAERLHVDSANVLLGGITLDLQGALARDSGSVADTLTANLAADSLSTARPELLRVARMLAPIDSGLAKTLRGYATDTLAGDVSGTVVLMGALPAFTANASLAARNMKVGILNVRRVFGSVGVTGLPDHAHFDATATVDDISGIGQVKLSNAEFRIDDASPAGGRLRLDVTARDTTALRVRGAFTRSADVLAVALDSLRFNYGATSWLNQTPTMLTSDARGLRVDSLLVRSNQGGVLALSADVPIDGAVVANVHVDRLPAGEIATFATGSATRYRGLLAGDTKLRGTRALPLITWSMRADSVGTDAVIAPPIVTEGAYENQRLVAHAVLADSVKSRLRAEARVPINLAIAAVDKRLLSANLDAEIVADSLRLESLPALASGVSNLHGVLDGRLALSGTPDRPVATGKLVLDNFGGFVDVLGITPTDGRLVVSAEKDLLTVEQFRFRSGPRATDTVGVSGVLQFPEGKVATIDAQMTANNAVLSRQSDGTDLDLSGSLTAKGPLKRPNVTASLFVPRANLVADPLGARSALDLGSAQARELLGATEVPVAVSTMDPVARLGQYMNVTQASVTLGDEVWVRTPESNIKLGGALDIKSAPSGLLALDGEVSANRGTFLLELGVVKRSFRVDSGSVRFFGSDAVPAKVGVYATNVVRSSTGEETPIHVAITGTFDKVALSLSTDDDVFSGAPESEVISLLVFGAPTFALSSQSQSTVKAVTGVFFPSLGGAVQPTLQRLLPYFNTFELSTAGGQQDFSSTSRVLGSVFNNLNIAAGKQIGNRTFLRINAGLCRSSSGSSDVKISPGLSAEYRFSPVLYAQIGVDQGAAPCTQLGSGGTLPPYQFGFDLFRQWVY